MKKLVLICAILYMISYSALAEVYLIVDNATDEVYTVSQKDDTILPEGMELIVLNGTIMELGLEKHPLYYKYIEENFILNNVKINEDYQANLDAIDLAEDMELIDKKMKEIAFDALVDDGHSFKKVKKADL